VKTFGRVKDAGRNDFGDDRSAPLPRRLDFRDLGQGRLVLSVVMRKNRRTILAADVMPLAIGCSRIVDREEYLEQLLIGNQGRIKMDSQRFCVPTLA